MQILNPQERYIAIFDVLGFKKIIKTNSIIEVAQKYRILLSYTKKYVAECMKIADFQASKSNCAIFSDSILMWSTPLKNDATSLGSVSTFFDACSNLISGALHFGLPVRLGVAYGPVIVYPEESIFIGQPIVDAYQTEAIQNWVGGVCHDSCENAPHFDRTKEWVDVLNYDVPLRNGTKRALALNWGRGMWDRSISLCEQYVKTINDEDVLLKYFNTITFLKNTYGIYTSVDIVKNKINV